MSHERNEHVDRAWSLGAGTMSRPQRGLRFVAVLLGVLAASYGFAMAASPGEVTSEDLEDDSGNNLDLTERGELGKNSSGTAWGEGVGNFSDGSDFANLTDGNADQLRTNGDLTFIVVVRLSDLTSTQSQVFTGESDGDPRSIEVNSNGNRESIRLRLRECSGSGTSIDTGNAQLSGNIHAVGLKYENLTDTNFLHARWDNGTQSRSNSDSTFNGPCNNSWEEAVIGALAGLSGTHGDAWNEDILDVRVYHEALSNSTIDDLIDHSKSDQTELTGDEVGAWGFGDTLQAPFVLQSDTEFSLSSPGRAIATTHATTANTNVYVRTNPGSGIDGGHIVRFDEALAVQNRIIGCDGPGLRNVTGGHGLTVSWDNLVAARCETAGDDPVVAVYDSVEMLDTVRFQTGTEGVGAPVHMESNTLNRVVFDDGDSVDFYSADVPDENVVRRGFGSSASFSQVAIDRDPSNNVSWVAGQNDEGTFVASSMGGVKLVDNSTFTQGVVQLFNRTLWTANAQENVTKLEIVNASDLEEVRRAPTDLNVEAGLLVSMDGRYLLEQTSPSAEESVVLRDAGNLSQLVTLGTDADVEDVALDRCNNFAYVVTGGSSPVVQRFDVSQNTSTSAGGNGTTGLNPCPDNPFTADTQGSIGDGKSAIEEEPDGFASQLKSRAASGFGMTEDNAGFFLGGLFLLGFALIGAHGVSRVGGRAKWGAGIGLGAGLAFTLAMDLIPLWFVLVMALVAAAVVVFRR